MLCAKLCVKFLALTVLFWFILIIDAGLAGKKERLKWRITREYPLGICTWCILTYLSGAATIVTFIITLLKW